MTLITKYIIWLLLLVIVGSIVLILIRKVRKKKFYAFPREFSSERGIKEKKGVGKKLEEGEDLTRKPEKAEHSLVLHGRKETAGVIAVRIDNLAKVKLKCRETINNVMKTISDNKGAVYETYDFIIGIFSSQTTKTFNNEIIAVKVSKQINEILKEHNKKEIAEKRIGYGISLNSGELIVRKEQDKLKFTAVGNTLNLAKKIALLSDKEVLLSENIQRKIMGETRTEKEIREGMNVYHIKAIMERDKHKEFISDFLRRVGEKK